MSNYDPSYVPKKTYARIGQKALILDEQGRILVLQRSEKSGAGGKWSLPGGAIDFGEEPEVSIKREIEEEVQLKVTDCKVFTFRSYIHTDNDHIIMIGWVCKAMSKDVTLNWEHDAFKWLSKEEALQLDLTEDGRFFIEHFDSNKL